MRVQPIRDIEELHGIERMLAAQETERGRRAYLLFELGIYLARRVSDILPLKVGDLLGREYLQIRESPVTVGTARSSSGWCRWRETEKLI